MGLGSVESAYVIEYEELKKLCPTAIKNIEKERFFESIGWLGIAMWFSGDFPRGLAKNDICHAFLEENEEDSSVTIEVAWSQAEAYLERYEKHIQNLLTDFKDISGLELGFREYWFDAGSRYDDPGDKEGCIFVVDGMTQPTPAGEKFKHIVTKRFWTQYG